MQGFIGIHVVPEEGIEHKQLARQAIVQEVSLERVANPKESCSSKGNSSSTKQEILATLGVGKQKSR